MNQTAEVLRKIKDICNDNRCSECPLDEMFCTCVPSHWTDNEIGIITTTIDDYKEEK